jgi:uncharacterized protein YebE (UPF0316 family)
MPPDLFDAVPALLIPPLIFLLRTIDLSLSTLRTLAIARGKRLPAWVLGFGQSLLFVTAIVWTLENLGNPINLLAFALGFASGNVAAIQIENWLAPGHSLLRILSREQGPAIAQSLYASGYGATELDGQSPQGPVTLILSYLPRKKVGAASRRIAEVDPSASITVEHVTQLRGGWQP